jgi:hypothetical protein
MARAKTTTQDAREDPSQIPLQRVRRETVTGKATPVLREAGKPVTRFPAPPVNPRPKTAAADK